MSRSVTSKYRVRIQLRCVIPVFLILFSLASCRTSSVPTPVPEVPTVPVEKQVVATELPTPPSESQLSEDDNLDEFQSLEERARKYPAPDLNLSGWKSYFDGQTLKGWKESEFGGENKVHVQEGKIVLDFPSNDLTGVTCTESVPRMNYEIALKAMRIDGTDFFCGLTFPVNDSCCSLIVGGWGGTLVGISSFNNMDASNNETTKMMNFEKGKWYDIRVRVTPKRIQAWIDQKLVVDAFPKGRKISVRSEIAASQPFGIAAWHTRAGLRAIQVREMTPEQAAAFK